ncbi:hypothetical protein HNR50_001567 [Spirochaeta isovalerica]|uniref:Uncharacterized protein n=1 Tax=Spirochaeta isovalerica TaxID=150 RepID=A0A841RAF4_9SPIO|nr:hypothetical protein [Spirochaeta isovalerica]
MYRSRRFISEGIVNSYDMASLAKGISRASSELEFPSIFVLLYHGEDRKNARIVIQEWKEKESSPLANTPFPAREILPQSGLERLSGDIVIINNLFFLDNIFGFIVIEKGPEFGEVYSNLISQISTALRGIEVLNSLKKSENDISIKVSCPPDLEINVVPLDFFQILTELIDNSILHCDEQKEDKSIELDVEAKAPGILFYTKVPVFPQTFL